jgi:hypothetical protein
MDIRTARDKAKNTHQDEKQYIFMAIIISEDGPTLKKKIIWTSLEEGAKKEANETLKGLKGLYKVEAHFLFGPNHMQIQF